MVNCSLITQGSLLSGLEKCVGKRNIVYALHRWVIDYLWIYKEKDWHVNLLLRTKSLFLKTETLDFVEI